MCSLILSCITHSIHTHTKPNTHTRTHARALLRCNLQDKRVMDKISSYFNKQIAEIVWDDEDAFLVALQESM